MNKEEYEAKRQARLERLQAASTRAKEGASQLIDRAREMASVIPFGQPILLNHHSEQRDRNYRGRIENKFRKGFDLYKKAEYYAERAEAARDNQTIFSDDPSASEKIEEKIARLEKRQEVMKAANGFMRKGNWEGLADLGFSEAQVAKLISPDFAGRPGYPPYMLSNNGAEIRRLKERLKILEIRSKQETSEKQIGPVRVLDNVEENRLQLFFPDKPEEAIRAELGSHGFRWSRTNNCWQAFRGPNANYWSGSILNKYYGGSQ